MKFDTLLSELDTVLKEAPAAQDMNEQQFEAYVQDQVAKAKKDAEDDKDAETGKKKAKKRLEHLRGVVAQLQKDFGDGGGWTGTTTVSIPVYEGGFTYGENLTVKADQSETTINALAIAGASNQAGTFGMSNGGAIAKSLEGLDSLLGEKKVETKKADETAPAPRFQWPGDVAAKDFMKEGVVKRAEQWGTDDTKSS